MTNRVPSRNTQTRIKRLLRIRRKQAERFGALAEDQLERNLVRKFSRLYSVRRFVAVWLLLCVVLIGCVVVQTRALGGYYQALQPARGGIFREGIIGTYTSSNPLYVTGQVNDAVSKLLFAGLFKYDDQNRLVGDLAERYELDPAGTTYTVRLKPNLTWHDGKPLTADDVVFTYQTIQNPDAQSPLNVSWQGVGVSASDPRTVVFKLPNPLSSFPHSLTTGIVPKHAFADTKVANYRSVPFNTVRPVGSGPYRLKTIEVTGNSPTTRQEEIELVPFNKYHAGAPAISSFVVHTYPDEKQMVDGFEGQEIDAMVGLQKVPKELEDDNVQATVMPLTAANMVFFKTTEGVLADKAVRQALVGGVNVDALTKDLQKPVLPVRAPILPSTPGYDPTLQQLNHGAEKSTALLDQQGWVRQANGIRAKGGQQLTFKLYAQNTSEQQHVVKRLQQQWRNLGADVQIYLQADADLRSTVASHSYDALLYGISLGVDPDMFVYWHSTQADVRSPSRLNLSEYKSDAADASLEDGRTRDDPALRTVKYRPFLQTWQQDAPALGLYQPRFLYVTRSQVHGLKDRTLTSDVDRFNNVHEWMVRRVPQTIK
jgi:peptide/nickel transport system substrate-binding protein